jgi:hypothetical protein
VDKFIYEPVFVGTYERAVLATILNGSVEAVIIYEGIPLVSPHDAPVLREFLATKSTVVIYSPSLAGRRTPRPQPSRWASRIGRLTCPTSHSSAVQSRWTRSSARWS